MTQKPLLLREQAIRDVDNAVTFYRMNAGNAVAGRFVDALERGYRHVEQYPSSGSLRLAHELEMTNLRTWPVAGFPYIVFFIERDTHIEILRVLHGARDIPTSLQEQ